MKREYKSIIRIVFSVAVIVLLIAAVATPVLARYFKTSDPLDSDYNIDAEYQPTINTSTEEFEDELEDVYITVEDNGYPVYVRVAIEIHWFMDGSVYFKEPEVPNDYTIDLNVKGETTTGDWVKKGDFYYLPTPVASGKDTPAIINSCALAEEADPPADGLKLHVKIMVQTIQAIGKTQSGVLAWTDAWAVADRDFQ